MMTRENPFLNAHVAGNILEKQIERDALSLRKAVQKVLNDYSVSMDIALPFMATLQPLEDVVAKGRIAGQDYLEAITRFCIEQTVATIPPSTKKPVDTTKPHVVGTGAERHIDTGAVKMPQRSGPKQTQVPLEETPDEPKPATTVLGNPIPDVVPDVEIPDEHKAALDNLRSGNHQSFDADPLTGKPDDVIQGEVIEEDKPSELDAAFGPKPHTPLFDYDAPMTVANMLSKAFPEKGTDYRLHFFREITGLNLVRDATTVKTQFEMFDKLKAGIVHALANPVITSDQPNTSVENATEKPTENGQIQNAPSTDSNQSKPPQTLPQSATETKALAIVPKNEVATTPKAISFKMPTPEEFTYMQALAKSVAASRFYKDIDNYDKALVIMMKGFALGVDPMTALDGIYIVAGRPYLGAKFVKALLERTGECIRFDVIGDEHQCTVTIQRRGRNPNTYTFGYEDAVRAKLDQKDTYLKTPGKMYKARAIKDGVDTEFPELSFGFGLDEDEEAA